MIRSSDDGVLRTHDEVRECLAYAVPGAQVRIFRPRLRHWAQRNSEKSRAYTIMVRRGGAPAIAVNGAYSLPCEAAPLVREAIEEVRKRTEE